MILTTSAVGATYEDDTTFPTEETDADEVFGGSIDFGTQGSSIELQASSGDRYTHAFSGLDEQSTYDFAGTAIVGDESTDRWTLVTLNGAEAFRTAHSDGIGIVTDGLPDNEVASSLSCWKRLNERVSRSRRFRPPL